MITVSVNNLSANDINELEAIEKGLFLSEPWGTKEFVKALNNMSSLCLKAEGTNKIVGYMFYVKDDQGGLEIVNLAVVTDYQRLGLGRRMVNILLKNKLFKEIYFSIPESILEAQLFAKKMGFKAVKIIPDLYKNNEAGYFFTNNQEAKCEYTYNKDKNRKARAA
jgi:ribosomal protein S18 acetylase RimI-like enzyme